MKIYSYILGCILALSNLFTGNAQSEIESEDILIMNDSIKLPGTLTYHKNKDTQPLIIFIQGSGNPDRNGNQLAMGVKANYIKMLRDSLNAKGIAFYSYDKRNVTYSNLTILKERFLFEDLAEDVKLTTNHFKDDKRFSEITLIGHSQGSLVAMMAINDNINSYISLAGLSETADEAIIRQVSAQSEALGKVTREHFKELKETGTIKEINPLLISIFVEANQEFLASYMAYDPVEIIKKIEIPTLVINGNKDIQVKEESATALHNANPKSQLVIIENMNHVLKTIHEDEDNLKSYMSDEFPLSEQLVKVISKFIKHN